MKWTIYRRISQISILLFFILGNHYGVKILQGNLSSSLLFNTVNLSDPLATLQIVLASIFGGLGLTSANIFGALIILIFYAFIAPRAFCGWVCPVNIITDLAAFLRKILGIKTQFLSVGKNTRYLLLIAVLASSLAFGILAFESINFIANFTREILSFGFSAIAIFAVILLFDIFATSRAICSKLCPLGAFYAIVSKPSILRVKHTVSKCTNCGKCRQVCPEVQVLSMVGKNDGVVGSECISCGRCVEICDDDALKFSILGVKR